MLYVGLDVCPLTGFPFSFGESNKRRISNWFTELFIKLIYREFVDPTTTRVTLTIGL